MSSEVVIGTVEVFHDNAFGVIDPTPVFGGLEIVTAIVGGLRVINTNTLLQIAPPSQAAIVPEHVIWPYFTADFNILLTRRDLNPLYPLRSIHSQSDPSLSTPEPTLPPLGYAVMSDRVAIIDVSKGIDRRFTVAHEMGHLLGGWLGGVGMLHCPSSRCLMYKTAEVETVEVPNEATRSSLKRLFRKDKTPSYTLFQRDIAHDFCNDCAAKLAIAGEQLRLTKSRKSIC